MALERRNPLPPNRLYYVDVPPDDQQDFADWLRRYKPAVKVRSTTREPMETGLLWDSSDYLEKYIFEVTAPLVFWEGPGFPTIGQSTEENPDLMAGINDLYQKEAVDTGKEVESERLKAFKKGAWIVGGVLAGVVAVHAFVGSALPKLLLRRT